MNREGLTGKLYPWRRCRIPIIFITGRGDIPLAVSAMKEGRATFTKPVDGISLLNSVERALQQNLANRREVPNMTAESLDMNLAKILIVPVRALFRERLGTGSAIFDPNCADAYFSDASRVAQGIRRSPPLRWLLREYGLSCMQRCVIGPAEKDGKPVSCRFFGEVFFRDSGVFL